MIKALAEIAKKLKHIRKLLKRFVDNEAEFIAWSKGEGDSKEIPDDELKNFIL